MNHHYGLDYLRHCGKASSLQGIKEAGRVYGYVSLKAVERWEWKHSEMNVRHLMSRHYSMPLPKVGHSDAYRPGTATVCRQSDGRAGHIVADDSGTNCLSFYERNNQSYKAKRAKERLS